MVKLEAYMRTEPGRALQVVLDVDFMLSKRISVSGHAMTYLEFQLLRALEDEREQYKDELSKRKQPASPS